MTSPSRHPPLSPATRAAQALRHVDGRTGGVTPAIDLSSTFARDEDYAPRRSYIYARDGGPTVEHAEAVLADLDGAAASLAFSSGMSALVALMDTLRAGDHVAAPAVMYHGGIAWLRRLAERRGIEVTFFDATADGALEEALRPGKTRLLWIETPTNPTWDVIDVAAAADAAHAAGARVAVDCTVAPPCTMRSLELGADFAFHSGTKYMGGHSDLTAGVLSAARTDDLWDEIRLVRTLTGGVIAPFEAWLLIRGIRTLFLRYERASASALTIARHFKRHPGVARVLYPGLPAHPRHEIAARQMTGGFGGMLSILANGDAAAARDVARFVEVFLPATSLGGVESLIEHRKTVEGPASLVPDTLLRLSIGIEDPADLIADLEQALGRAGCAPGA
jgi:cystathionine gamma-synthase